MLGSRSRVVNQDDLKSVLGKRYPSNTDIGVVQRSIIVTMGRVSLSGKGGAALRYTRDGLVFSCWVTPTDTLAGRRVSVYFESRTGLHTKILIADAIFDVDEA